MSGADPHPSTEELGYLGAVDALAAMERGDVSASDLVDAMLQRIDHLDAAASPIALRSVAAVAADARDLAARRDEERRAGRLRGALHGVPVVIKDNIEAEGLPGAAGSTSLLRRPARDAPLVTRLREAGAIVMGSTNLSEWANIRSQFSTSGWSATGGLVGNPWALDRSAGGSSSGSGAALAAGLAPLAIGTETDGSITCPASLNGVVGLKPTVGTVPGRGIVPISRSQDSAGPMARSVDDVAFLYGVLANQPAPRGGGRLRLLHAASWLSGHPGTDAHVADVVAGLRSAGLEITTGEPATPAPSDHEDELTVLLCELVDDLSLYLAGRPGPGPTSLAEVVAHEREHHLVELPHFGHDLFERALTTGGRRGPHYADARARNLEWAMNRCLAPAFDGVDVLIAPAYAPAWKSDLTYGGSPEHAASCATMPAAIAGWPILSLPLGLVDGLPVGLAMLARPHDEWTLLRAAREIESALALTTAQTRPTWRLPARG